MLNAFRHHGERREAVKVVLGKSKLCSTPSGITASGGAGPNQHSLCSWLCSTPSGITASGGPH
ncbi:hypothetical protein, partial [Myxococcus eversor]|uniref:hypothetical protein n=1 Tax=Myxococcus eversor TaxID=2709661 RepID=UPI003B8370B1